MRRSSWLPIWLALAVGVLAACTRAASPLPQAPEPGPTPAPPVSLPQDAAPHSSLTEWWYYTGHLHSAQTGRNYGFEFTIFQAERQAAPSGLLAHFAISDLDGQSFSHQARFVQLPSSTVPTFPLDVDGWQLSSQAQSDTISAAMSAGPGVAQPYVLNLKVTDEKPPALHNGGYIEYGIAGGSYYYSRTRLTVSGTLGVGSGDALAVDGIAWMDHQWGNFVVASGGGWDWYSLQLDDRTELMLYVLRAASGETTGVYGTEVLADGTLRDLLPGTVTAVSTGTWLSPHTGGRYPSGWLLTRADGTQLRIEPALADQELYFPGLNGAESGVGVMSYWEGAVRVSGDRTGVGYVELTGYRAQST